MTYKEYKENGICIRCHSQKATHGVVCERCYCIRKEYSKKYDKETYYWAKSKGLCVGCKSEKAVNGTNYCLECLMRRREYTKPLQGDKKEQKAKKSLDRYYENKQKGICVQCGKRPADNSVFCKYCKSKKNCKAEKKRREKGILPADMGGNGVYCAICFKPVEIEGNKLCDRCYENSLRSIRKAQLFSPKDNYFRKTAFDHCKKYTK